MKTNKPTKFLILESCTDWYDSDQFTHQEMEQIQYCSDPYMMVIECHHPNFRDNVVILTDKDGNEFEFVKTTQGNLHAFDDFKTKMDLVKAFE